MSNFAFFSSHKIPRCLCTRENRWKQPHTCPEVKCWKMKEEPPAPHCSLDRLSAPGFWTNFREMANTQTTFHPCWNTSCLPASRGHCPTSHHGLKAPEGGQGGQTPGRAWLSWPCCPFSFQSVDGHKKVSHRHQEYRRDLRSVCDTQTMTTTKQARSGAGLIFVVGKVSTKKVGKRVDRQLGKAGFKFLVYHRVFVWPQWSCLFPAHLSNRSVGGAEEKYIKKQEVSGYRSTQEL